MKEKQKKVIPFNFVLERLDSLDPFVRPMFGCHAIYVGEKIVLILRQKDSHTEDNGVWVAMPHEHRESLSKEFADLRSVKLLGDSPTAWQNIPYPSEAFEESVMKACDLILKRDPRIGKVPGSRRKKGVAPSTKSSKRR